MRIKNKLDALSRDSPEELPSNMPKDRNIPRNNDKFIKKVSEESEGRVTQKTPENSIELKSENVCTVETRQISFELLKFGAIRRGSGERACLLVKETTNHTRIVHRNPHAKVNNTENLTPHTVISEPNALLHKCNFVKTMSIIV